jgi:hypothetical protein
LAEKDRSTYCLVRRGTVFGLDRLARALSELNARGLESRYGFPPGTFQTHATTITTNWTFGDGFSQSLQTYGGQGPLRAWMAQQLTLALLAEANWETTEKKPVCDARR